MEKKILAIGFIVLLLITGLICIPTVASLEREQGTIDAALGKRGNERPLVILNGSYHSRNRYLIVGGTAKVGERLVRFRGVFTGNHFAIRIPIGGSTFTIFGKCRFDKEHQTFMGVWIGRGIPFRGWITGTFFPLN